MTADRGRPRTGARELARRAMKAEISARAFDLFVERGYEATTVEDICASAGISRSTFFRYFASKEDALLGDLVDAGDRLRAALEARPDSETPWTALLGALAPLIDHYAAKPDHARRLARLITTTPALAALHREKNAGLHETLRPELARRLGADPTDRADPRVAALVGAALGCVDATIAAWLADDGRTPLQEILDRAGGAIGR